MSAKTNCISVDERQVHDIFSINHDQSALGFFWLELREVFYLFYFRSLVGSLRNATHSFTVFKSKIVNFKIINLHVTDL